MDGYRDRRLPSLTFDIPSAMSGILPFGYYIVRHDAAVLTPGCPAGYVTVAGCLCKAHIPDSDCIPLCNTDFEPERLAEKWEISLQAAKDLYRFNEDQYMQIDYATLSYRNWNDARWVRANIFPQRDDILLICLGAIDDAFWRYPGIQEVSPFPPDAQLLGFDVYEFGNPLADGEELKELDFTRLYTMGLSCTLRCCDPEGEIPARLGISLNSDGFYPDADSARKIADLVNHEHLAEPCRYLPFAVYHC